jgi:cytoskeletal protein RodZ
MEPQQSNEPSFQDYDDAEGHGPAMREGVGEILRRKRESYGQDLPTVAAQLHIRLTYLRAVESGRFKDLPGMAYASGFVRSYGDYLGLDGEELVRLFREEVAGIRRQVRLSAPIVASEGRIPGGAILLISGFLALVAYGVWYYLADRHKSFMDLVPEVPSQLRAILGKEVPTNVPTAPPVVKPTAPASVEPKTATAAAAGNQPATAGAASAAGAAPTSALTATAAAGGTSIGGASVAGAASAPAMPSAAAGTSGPPAAAVAPPAPPPPPATSVLAADQDLAPLPAEFSAMLAAARAPSDGAAGQPAPPAAEVVLANPGARVRLFARMDSWVQINDKSGKTYYAAVLRAGQAIEVPNLPGLLLTAGNLGGLDVSVDGETIAPLGAVGLVKRDLPLDPAGLKSKATVQ